MTIDLKVLLGGILLGLTVGLMLLVRGQILGCSGMLFRLWDFSTLRIQKDKLAFISGLILSGLIFNFIERVPNPQRLFETSTWLLFLGGVLVGSGTFLGNGCTSGHGLCGMALMRKRSITAVLIFFSVAILTSWLIH